MRRAFALGLTLLLAASGAIAAPPSDKAMVAAANPVAVEAGLKVLRAGGSAVDAAVAVQVALGLVEPQSSGIGGGAFLVYYDAHAHKVTAYDGREIAPAGATPDMFLRPDGTQLSFGEAVLSGRSAGVPGAVAMLSLAQHEHGKVGWSSLFEDTAKLADSGFTIGPRLAHQLTTGSPETKAPDVLAYFTKPGCRAVTSFVIPPTPPPFGGSRLRGPLLSCPARSPAISSRALPADRCRAR